MRIMRIMRGEATPESNGGGARRSPADHARLDVYLVRHAVAHKREPRRWPDDDLRPLTSTGKEAFRPVARALGRLESEVEAVFSSSLTRAWQTAEILESEGGWPAPQELPELDPETPAAEVFAALSAVEDLPGAGSVALVGHRPNLHELASYMVSGDPQGAEVKIKKGEVVVVRFSSYGGRLWPGAGVLRGIVPPELLNPSL